MRCITAGAPFKIGASVSRVSHVRRRDVVPVVRVHICVSASVAGEAPHGVPRSLNAAAACRLLPPLEGSHSSCCHGPLLALRPLEGVALGDEGGNVGVPSPSGPVASGTWHTRTKAAHAGASRRTGGCRHCCSRSSRPMVRCGERERGRTRTKTLPRASHAAQVAVSLVDVA